MAFSSPFIVTVLTWLLTFNWMMTGGNGQVVRNAQTVGTATSTKTSIGHTVGSEGNVQAKGNVRSAGTGKPEENAPVKRKLSTCNLQSRCKKKKFHECDFSGCANEAFLDLRGSSLSGTLPTQLLTMVNLRNLYVRTKHLEAQYLVDKCESAEALVSEQRARLIHRTRA